MQCFNPTVAFKRHDNTKIAWTPLSWAAFIKRKHDIYNIPELKNTIFSHGQNINLEAPLKIPCGKCDACFMNRARDLATRCMMEFHSANYIGFFLTLTYDEEHLPTDRKYDESHVVKFMKRLRKKTPQIRSIGVAEYGEQTRRPHYHLLIFGWEPADKVLVRTSDSSHAGENFQIFTSKTLDKLWTYGKHEFGTITEQSCSYVARYTQKKVKDKSNDYKAKTICRSRRPGLGAHFTDRFGKSIASVGSIILKSSGETCVELPTPRYVFDRLCKISPDYHAILSAQRADFEKNRNFYEESKGRVKAKKIIFKQKISKLKRNL